MEDVKQVEEMLRDYRRTRQRPPRQRLSSVPSMFSSLEVKVFYPT